jgi:anti-anti-sigma regulatory factor
MCAKTRKSDYISQSITGRFDAKTAVELMGRLEERFKENSISGARLDFSSATHITTDGIAALQRLGDQLQFAGKELVISEMPSELYKALKVAGISDAMMFAHRSVLPPSA